MDVDGAAALVTGGAGGLGGARVVIADLARDKGEALAGSLGEAAMFMETDVTSEDSLARAFRRAEELGPVRAAVAVHGGFGGGGRTLKSDGTPHALDDFRRTVEHYLVGTFNVVRLGAAAIARSEPLDGGERGVLINTASIAGYEGTIGTVAYASAKGGVLGMTIAAARDLAVVGIRVVTIAPGTFLTPAYGMDPDAVEAMWAPAIPFPKRMGRPDEYARLVEAICENRYLNGEVIRIDGAIRFGPKSPR
jgi:NAD(P)-dependent dehydrogenase (short-subunit alcohol dehydrogenase family)